jgi:hypothetical protein
MKLEDNVLIHLSEECSEVTKDVCKALRFGLDNVGPNNDGKTNAELISEELTDLIAMASLLRDMGLIPPFGDHEKIVAKIRKVEKFQSYSESVGRLEK